MQNSNNINAAAISGDKNLVIAHSVSVTGVENMSPLPEKLPELWEAPEINRKFIGRIELLKQIEHHYSQNNTHVILTACHGLGGIGKTQVALQYVWENYKNYKGVVWFNAEDQDQLHKDYISLGRQLKIIRDEGNIESEELARYVKYWLENPSHAGWLLVYDNAPNYEIIEKLLPIKEGSILITSRYTDGWPHKNIFVDMFTIEESRDYIEKELEIQHPYYVAGGKVDFPILEFERQIKLRRNDYVHIDTLAKKLGRLPLALAIACRYIVNQKISISSYLELYEQRKRHLLSTNKRSKSNKLFEKEEFVSVYITWDITMDQIRTKYILTVKFLNTFACLASNDIPHYLLKFATSQNNPGQEEFEALETLKKYSILEINKQNSSTSIHRLIQEVVQFKWGAEEKKNNFIAVLNLLKGSVPCSSKEPEDYTKRRQLLPHLESFLSRLEAWQQETSEVSPKLILETYLGGTLLSGEWNKSLGNKKRALERSEQAKIIKEELANREKLINAKASSCCIF